MSTAPIKVASKINDASSNGSSQRDRNALPIAAVVGAISGSTVRMDLPDTPQGAATATKMRTAAVATNKAAPEAEPRLALDMLISEMRLVNMMAKRIKTRTPPM